MIFLYFQEEKLKQLDPKKAAQAERLGMGGFSGKASVGHSAITEISSIEQVHIRILFNAYKVACSVTRKNWKMSIKVAQKWFH